MLTSMNHDLLLWESEYPWFRDNIRDQISDEELQIQKWWSNKIDVSNKEVNILNAGMAAYSLAFCIENGAAHTRLIDMDPITKEISNLVNNPGPWSHLMMDVTFDYEHIPEADIYINTSCEHSFSMKNVIPKNKLCVLSGCNLTKRGHINLIQSCNDLIEQAGISNVTDTHEMIFERKDDLGIREYSQYFVIGEK